MPFSEEDKRRILVTAAFDQMDLDSVYQIAMEHIGEWVEGMSAEELTQQLKDYDVDLNEEKTP